jgi:hypothetical protein
MSIRFGSPDNICEVISEIREDDKLFYKIFSRVYNGDDKEAYKIIRVKFQYSFMDAKRVIHKIKEVYNEKQIVNLLKYICENNPEYTI